LNNHHFPALDDNKSLRRKGRIRKGRRRRRRRRRRG
jgi:hypothetical protein